MDVPACLQEALERKRLDMRVAALVRKLFVCLEVMIHFAFFPHYDPIIMQVGLMGLAISHITSFNKFGCSGMYFMFFYRMSGFCELLPLYLSLYCCSSGDFTVSFPNSSNLFGDNIHVRQFFIVWHVSVVIVFMGNAFSIYCIHFF